MLTDNEIKSKIVSTIASVFYLDESEVNDNISPDTVKAWDSVGHLNLVLALEEEFATSFTSEQTIGMISLPLIIFEVSENLKNAH